MANPNSNAGVDTMLSGRRRRTTLLATISTVVAVALVAAVMLRPREEARPIKTLGVNGIATSRDNTRIAFTKLGSGPPLILVDGAFCYRENGPAPELAPLLGQHFTVFTYDRRGRGESGDTPPY